MRFKIFSEGIEINRIVSDEDFCKKYCEENEYTYEKIPEPEPEQSQETEPEPTIEEMLDVILGVNTNE